MNSLTLFVQRKPIGPCQRSRATLSIGEAGGVPPSLGDCRTDRAAIEATPRSSWNRTSAKVVDNAIVGYSRRVAAVPAVTFGIPGNPPEPPENPRSQRPQTIRPYWDRVGEDFRLTNKLPGLMFITGGNAVLLAAPTMASAWIRRRSGS
jgi:hypothetical protein